MLCALNTSLRSAGRHIASRRRHLFVPSIGGAASPLENRALLLRDQRDSRACRGPSAGEPVAPAQRVGRADHRQRQRDRRRDRVPEPAPSPPPLAGRVAPRRQQAHLRAVRRVDRAAGRASRHEPDATAQRAGRAGGAGRRQPLHGHVPAQRVGRADHRVSGLIPTVDRDSQAAPARHRDPRHARRSRRIDPSHRPHHDTRSMASPASRRERWAVRGRSGSDHGRSEGGPGRSGSDHGAVRVRPGFGLFRSGPARGRLGSARSVRRPASPRGRSGPESADRVRRPLPHRTAGVRLRPRPGRAHRAAGPGTDRGPAGRPAAPRRHRASQPVSTEGRR